MGSPGADNDLFELDTKGICLLCLRKCSSSSCSGDTAATTSLSCDSSSFIKSTDASGEKEKERAFQSFKMLMRYLNIDVLQQCNFSSSFLQSVDGLQRDVKMVVKMCSICLEMCQQFAQIFKQFEMIRLQLDECVQSLYSLMQSGDKNKDRVWEYERLKVGVGWNPLQLFHANIADNLRKETMRKCSLKVDNLIPRVTISKPVSYEDPDYCSVSSPICVITETKGDLDNDENFQGPMSMLKVETTYNDDDGEALDRILNSNKLKNEDPYSDVKAKIEDPLANGYGSPSDVFWAATPNTTSHHHPSSTSALHDCIHCGKTFASRSNLKVHQSYVHTLEAFSDQLPDGTTRERLKLAVDYCIGRHRRNEKNRCLCGFCDKNYRDTFNLKIHILDVHFDQVIIALANPSTMLTNHVTPSQSKMVAKKRTGFRAKHLSRPGRSGKGPVRVPVKPDFNTGAIHKCPICRKGFNKEAWMKRHIKKFHHTRQRTKANNVFSCGWCDKTFSTAFNMRSHVNSVHLYASNEDKLPPGTTELQLRKIIKIISNEQTIERGTNKNKTGIRCNFCGKMRGEPFFFRIHLVEYHFHEVINRLIECKDMLNADMTVNGDSSSNQLVIQQNDHEMEGEEEEEQEMPIENFRHSNILHMDSLMEEDNNADDYTTLEQGQKSHASNDEQQQEEHESIIDSQSTTVLKNVLLGHPNNIEHVDDDESCDVPPVLDLYDAVSD